MLRVAAASFSIAFFTFSVSTAQVLPETKVCKPTTSAKLRDANCNQCNTGPLSTRGSFTELVNKVRARRRVFEEVDSLIEKAVTDSQVADLLKGENLARSLYGSDADFVADGNGSRCLQRDNEFARSRAIAFPCEKIPREGLAVLLTAGQSNISNTGARDPSTKQLYEPHNVFYAFNRFDGKCYIASNPALGTLGDGENVAVRLGDDLIDRKIYKHVLIAPVAISGTYLEEWRPRGGKYFEVLLSAIGGLRDFNLEITAVLWHQGEYNASAFATSRAEDGTKLEITSAMKEAGRLSYIRNYMEIIAGIRAADVQGPIFIATATICGTIRSRSLDRHK
jgi:hypothetical protein